MSSYPDNLQRVAVYLRKSRADMEAEARGEGETLSKHRRAIMGLAKKYAYGIQDIYEEVVSGERIIDRPEMQRLLHAVIERQYTAVLCMDVDRLGRGNMVDQGLIQEAFKDSRTLIITPRKVYDLQDEMDEEWSEFEAFMARRELKIITRRMQRGRRQSASEGKHVGKKAPFGYLRDEHLKLHPDPETAPIVRQIFVWAAAGFGASRIQTYLYQLGYKSPRGAESWEQSSVYAILRNPVYRGSIVWGMYRTEKTSGKKSGRTRYRVPAELQTVKEHAHEPLVDEDTYQRFQEALGKKPKVTQTKEIGNALVGLIVCVVCGKTMQRQPRHLPGRRDRLFCRTQSCSNAAGIFDLVLQRVNDTIRQVLEETSVEPTTQKGVTSEQTEIWDRRIAQLQQELETLQVQRNRLHDLLEQAVYDIDTFLERNRSLGDRIAIAQTELQQAAQQKLTITEATLITRTEASSLWHQLERAANPGERNKIYRQLIDRIVYTRDKAGRKTTDSFELDIYLRF